MGFGVVRAGRRVGGMAFGGRMLGVVVIEVWVRMLGRMDRDRGVLGQFPCQPFFKRQLVTPLCHYVTGHQAVFAIMSILASRSITLNGCSVFQVHRPKSAELPAVA
jgi:hypothetical protein